MDIYKINKTKISYIYLFICMFLQCFIIKVYGVIDLQVLIIAFGLLLYCRNIRPVISVGYSVPTTVLIAFLGYSFMIILISDTPATFESFRIFRALTTSILLYFLIEAGRFDFYKVVNILIAIIAIHAITIVLELIFPSLKIVIASLGSFNKLTAPTRASGLLSSYDAAGAFLIMGIILSNAMYRLKPRAIYMYLVLFFWITGFGTGRTFMLIGSMFTAIVIWQYFVKTGLTIRKIVLGVVISYFGYLVLSYALPLIINTFLFTFYDEGSASNAALTGHDGYYTGSLSSLFAMKTLSLDLVETIFGTGGRLIAIDIGYYKIIYTFGVLGALFYITYVCSTYFYVKNKITFFEKRLIVLPLLLLFIIYNLKMQVFLSRGFHEFYLIIILSLVNWRKSIDQGRLDTKLRE